jgi:DNA-binding CsgD family transcriptional regulator
MHPPPGRWLRPLGILAYLLLLGILFEFNWNRMLQPAPLLSVLLGTLVLTLSQWKKGESWRMLPGRLKWNAFIAGLLTSLFSIIALLSNGLAEPASLTALSNSLIPFFYASLFALPWPSRNTSNNADEPDNEPNDELVREQAPERRPEQSLPQSSVNTPGQIPEENTSEIDALPDWQQEWLLAHRSAESIHRILSQQGFTPRECHVAQKLLEDVPNKAIAESLYISESTVKKHIQNLFRKCGATDRRAFRKLFLTWESAKPVGADSALGKREVR